MAATISKMPFKGWLTPERGVGIVIEYLKVVLGVEVWPAFYTCGILKETMKYIHTNAMKYIAGIIVNNNV